MRKWLLALCFAANSCSYTSDAGSGAMGCAIGFGTEPQNGPAVVRFETLRDRYFVRHLLYNPVTSTYLGADGYSSALQSANSALKDYSVDALTRELAFYQETSQELRDIDLETLPPHLRVDYRVMDAQLKFLIRQIGERKYYQRAVDTYVAEPFRGVDWQMQQMQDAGDGLRGTEEEWTQLAARVEAIPDYVANARANLLAGREADNLPDWRMVQRNGIDASLASVEYFRSTLPGIAAGYIGKRAFGAALLPQLRGAGERAASAWQEFAAFLRTTYGENDRTDRFAAGTEEYEWRTRNVFGDTRTAAELYDYGGQQVALYSRLIADTVAEIARTAGLRSASTRDIVNRLAEDAPRNDEELLQWYREAAARAVVYGRDRGMFDIPQDYKLDILPTPPVLRGGATAAYYMAPPFKASGIGRFYLAPTGNDPAQLRQNHRASIADTAVHEGFPGHDWHFKYMAQHASGISNVRWLTPGAVEDSSSMWSDSLAAEGWGLYAEELMAEPAEGRPHGFYSAPEYLYQLQGQMMRAVRVRVDVGIHTGRMTFDEARDYFVEHVEFYPGACAMTSADARAACSTAESAIFRYSKWPTQAIAYNLGKNAIVALRDAYKKKTGTAYSARTFHEKFMRMGTVPVAFFRDVF